MNVRVGELFGTRSRWTGMTWPILRRKCRTGLGLLPTVALYGLHAPWAIPGVLIIRALRPWLLVRLRRIHCERIGHFVGDTALFLAQWSVSPRRRRTVDLYWFPDRPSNHQWARMVCRTLTVRWWVRYLLFYNGAFPGGDSHIVPFVRGLATLRAGCSDVPLDLNLRPKNMTRRKPVAAPGLARR